jgi:hypothetical protein
MGWDGLHVQSSFILKISNSIDSLLEQRIKGLKDKNEGCQAHVESIGNRPERIALFGAFQLPLNGHPLLVQLGEGTIYLSIAHRLAHKLEGQEHAHNARQKLYVDQVGVAAGAADKADDAAENQEGA